MKKKKKKFEYSTIMIFIITLIVSLVILGIIAFVILNTIVFQKVQPSEVKLTNEIYTPNIKDNQTILIIGENKDNLEYTVLMFYNALESRIVFTPIPINTYSQVNTKKGTLSDFYEKHNTTELCNAVENLFDIQIQKYIELIPSSFYSIINNTGKISFPLICNMHYKNPQTNELTHFNKDNDNIFGANDLRKIITYPYYPNGVHHNNFYTGVIFAEIINQTVSTSEDVFKTFDNIYKEVVSKSNTTIDEYDFYSKKLSFRYMIKQNETPAIYSLPDGEINENSYFIMDDDYKKTVHEYICR